MPAAAPPAAEPALPPLPRPARAPNLPTESAQLSSLREFLGAQAPGREDVVVETAATEEAPLILYGLGSAVRLHGYVAHATFNGMRGVISGLEEDNRYAVGLTAGTQLERVKVESVALVQEVEPGVSSESYAPRAPGHIAVVELLKYQAAETRQMLETRYSARQYLMAWAPGFWQEVDRIHAEKPLHGALRGLLQAHGYVGPGTIAPPRVEDLLKELKSFEAAGLPSAGGASALFQVNPDGLADGNQQQEDDLLRWHNRLPSDLNRAGAEIYTSMRSSEAASVSDFVDRLFAGEARGSQTNQELFSAATFIDFRIASARSDAERLRLLNTDDGLEIHLRQVAR